MGFFKTAGLSAVFMVAADMAIAASTGMVGIHGLLVDGGASVGQAMGIPHVDWTNLMENGEFGWIDPGADPHAGHNHAGTIFDGLVGPFNEANPPDCENLHFHGNEPHCEPHNAPQNDAPIPFTS